jgi:hypothetical protein
LDLYRTGAKVCPKDQSHFLRDSDVRFQVSGKRNTKAET